MKKAKAAAAATTAADKCRYCLSEIPVGAIKCCFCQEWLDGRAESAINGDERIVAPRDPASRPPELPPASFQSRLAAMVPSVSYWTFYFALSMLFYIAISLHWTFGPEDRIFMVSFFFNALQMFFSAAGIVWFEKLLDRFRAEIPVITGWSVERSEDYYLKNRARVFSNEVPLAVGLIICTVAVIGDSQVIGMPFATDAGRIAYLVYEFCFLFWSASAIVYFIKFAMFIREFGDLELRILIIQEEESGIRMLGKFILQTTLFAVIPYICSITARHIGGWNFSSLLSLWFGLFGISLLFYLFWPIYNIHRAMIREKDRKLNLVSYELNSLLSRPRLDKENIHKVRNLLEIRNYLHEINTWPFDMSKVVGLLSAIIIPMASILVDRALKGGQ
ncbi:MAG: hypothetical protein CVV42_14655 [Candidatus Riflebacteria bacterium HGW-Riflebacteria-2]|jgi:hypothetical protein|nr:MAG: hypothetical protein CVV42_14655 [Candidatus Riflebacteria bacterium HGW-Riflebacteria-2]